MENEIKEITNYLLPSELKTIKDIIEKVLNEDINGRNGNLKFLNRYKCVQCPNGNGHHIKKNGHSRNTQRFWCHTCSMSFSITNDSIIKYSEITYTQFRLLLKGLYDLKPLNNIAQEIGLSRTSTFEISIRIMDAIDSIYGNLPLKELVEIDEKYVRISYKGNKKIDNMPRPSRRSGKDNLTSGISKDQLCIICAIDSYDHIIIKVAGNGPATTDMISNSLDGKIEKNSIIVTDSKSSYKEFSEKNELKLVQIPEGQHTIDGYSIANVNELMTEISTYLFMKRGISSRHLQQHLNFIRYRKLLKYMYEYLDINKHMYKELLKIPIKLTSKDVYSMPMPFNEEDYAEWCNEHY